MSGISMIMFVNLHYPKILIIHVSTFDNTCVCGTSRSLEMMGMVVVYTRGEGGVNVLFTFARVVLFEEGL